MLMSIAPKSDIDIISISRTDTELSNALLLLPFYCFASLYIVSYLKCISLNLKSNIQYLKSKTKMALCTYVYGI